MKHRHYFLLAAWLLLCGWGASSPTLAAEDDEEIARAPVEDQEDPFVDVPRMLSDEIDRWVFQMNGEEQSGREQLARQWKQRLEVFDRRYHLTAAQDDEDRIQAAWQEVMSLQQKVRAGIFGDNSLFSKTLHKSLTSEQTA